MQARSLLRPRAVAHLLIAIAVCALAACTAPATSDAPAPAAAQAAARPAPPATRKPAAHWKTGDKVSAVWPTDGRWYNATILGVADGGLFHVRYDDDGIERQDITAKQIRARGTGGGGGGGAAPASCPGPGLTRRCGGVCVNIQTDDNNCGSCGTRCDNGKHCDGHMFCRDANGNL